jgi:hypothetical protein
LASVPRRPQSGMTTVRVYGFESSNLQPTVNHKQNFLAGQTYPQATNYHEMWVLNWDSSVIPGVMDAGSNTFRGWGFSSLLAYSAKMLTPHSLAGFRGSVITLISQRDNPTLDKIVLVIRDVY